MKKAKKFFKMIAFISVLLFFAGPSSLLCQTAKEEQKQEPAINSLTQAKTDAQTKEEQEKAEAQNATTQSQAESQAKAENGATRKMHFHFESPFRLEHLFPGNRKQSRLRLLYLKKVIEVIEEISGRKLSEGNCGNFEI